MTAAGNPLLELHGLPRFGAIRPEHVSPAIERLIAEHRALVARLVADEGSVSWSGFAEPLDLANERLSRAWAVVAHLHAVDDNEAIRQAYNAVLPGITGYRSELAQHPGLYQKYKALRASAEFAVLVPAQQKIVENDLRDYRLGGAELAPADKHRFREIDLELAGLEARFSENVLDATNAFSVLVTDRGELAGIPDDVLAAAEAEARRDGKAGWKLSLQAPSYIPVMQYAQTRSLREKLYHAHVTRASEFGPPALDNTPLIARELLLRREKARLLGYGSFAEFSLVTKMADAPATVLAFLDELAQKALPYARMDYADLEDFSHRALGLPRLEAWDVAFASERLRTSRYAFSDNETKQYFPEHRVLAGLFELVERVFGIRVTRDSAEAWHPQVTFHRISAANGDTLGHFFLDLHSRESKRDGAWMDEAVIRRRVRDRLETPVAYLVCNFPAPVGERPTLLTHDEVITLFHEFGHGLHHLLSEVDYAGVSGIRGVEWDAVELPSQFMENFCWEWDVLRHLSSHVDTGEALPRALFDKMRAAKNFQSGMQTVRQVEFALADMRLHHDFDPAGSLTPGEVLDQIRASVAVALPPAYNRFLNNFSHVFAGGYAAGYYSYKWAEVLSADAYSLFEERGVLDALTGAQFRREILAVGGSRRALDSFRAFRGREPSTDALLRHSGMISG